MDIPEILKNKKVLLALGGVGVVLLVWKPWQSGGGSAPAPSIDYGSAAGSPDQSAQIASQINQVQSSIMGQVGDMLTTYRDQQNANTQALSQGFTQALTQMQEQNATLNSKIVDQMNTTLSSFQTQLQNQSSYFTQTVNRVAQTAAPAQVSNPTPTKPTITVAAGSPEAQYLNDEYGGKINLVLSTSNQFVGSDRVATNQMYRNYLGSQGIAPSNSLSADQLWKYN